MRRNPVECLKCSGTGYIPRFGHYAQGVCFDCGGTGFERPRRGSQALPSPPPKKAPEWVRDESGMKLLNRRWDLWRSTEDPSRYVLSVPGPNMIGVLHLTLRGRKFSDNFPDSGSREAIEHVLVKTYPVFTQDEIDELDYGSSDAVVDRIWSRFFDFKKAMIAALNDPG